MIGLLAFMISGVGLPITEECPLRVAAMSADADNCSLTRADVIAYHKY